MSSVDSLNAEFLQGVFGFISRSKNAIHQCTRYALVDIGERLVMYSAVGDPSYWKHPPHKGYAPGHFINNWQLGIDGIPGGVIPGSDASGANSLTRMSKVGRWPAYHDYYFVNNVPYAALLETGMHSPQVPPGGMVGRVRLEFPQIVRQAIARYHSEGGHATSVDD